MPRRRLAFGLLTAARPKQWVKNVLVAAAPAAAGLALEARPLTRVFVAFVAFCLAASGTYYLNDVRDRDADLLHPRKKLRPIASGAVPAGLAVTVGIALLCAGVATAAAVNTGLALIVASYVLLTVLYSLWLKHVPVIDLAAVASGFILRTVAGGVAVDVPISQWFLIVTSFGSLFIVAGKRHAEHVDLGEDAATHRPTLDTYSIGFLRYVRSVASAVTIAGYCLWAFERSDAIGNELLFELSIVPFVLGILYYALRLESGAGGEPEQIVLHDRTLQAIGLGWAGLFLAGVYVG